MQQDKKVEQPQNEFKQEPTLSISAKVILAVFFSFADDSVRFNVEGVRRRANHSSTFGTLMSFPN